MFTRKSYKFLKGTPILPLIRNISEYTGPKERCLNMVQLLGRVGGDPVVRGEETKFVTFSVATSINYLKTGPSGKQDYATKTEWHNVCVFRPFLVDRAEEQIKKGTRVMLTGSIEYNEYAKANGEIINTTRIVPDDIIVLSRQDGITD